MTFHLDAALLEAFGNSIPTFDLQQDMNTFCRVAFRLIYPTTASNVLSTNNHNLVSFLVLLLFYLQRLLHAPAKIELK